MRCRGTKTDNNHVPAKCALMKSKVVPSKLTLTPTPPLFPTRPPMSPAVTADFEVPLRCGDINGRSCDRSGVETTSNKRACFTMDEDGQIQSHHAFLDE